MRGREHTSSLICISMPPSPRRCPHGIPARQWNRSTKAGTDQKSRQKNTRTRNFGRAAAEEITHLLEDAIDYHRIQLNMHQYGGCERLGMNRHSMRTQIDERETNPRERVCGGEMNQRAVCDLMCKIKISTSLSPHWNVGPSGQLNMVHAGVLYHGGKKRPYD